MVLYTRRAQWAIKEESVAGSVESLAAADVLKVVSDSGVLLEGVSPIQFPDNTVHSELGRHPNFAPGVASWDLPTISIALAGRAASTASALSALSYSHLLEACGFEALTGSTGVGGVQKLTIGSITGATLFRHGEAVTSTGTGESGQVVGDTWGPLSPATTTTLYVYVSGSNAFDAGDVLTGADSGAVATVATGGAQAREVHAYRLLSNPDGASSLTIGCYQDGKRVRAKGCRGNVSLRCDHANRPFLDFNFKGILHNEGSAPYFHTDTAFLTGVESGDEAALAALGITMTIHDGTNHLTATNFQFNKFTLDMGNEVVLSENSNDADGWDVARIVNRAPKLSINPREVLSATGAAGAKYTFLDNLARGVTARSRITIGATSGFTSFTFIFPFLQAENLTNADRDGILEWDGAFNCTKGSYADASGNIAFGANNEVVLLVDMID